MRWFGYAGAQKRQTIQQAARVVTGVPFTGRRPRGSPVSQAIGQIEKNWLRFAVLQLRIVLALFY
jgi:hypothetical protein